jgi:hypothetical protein
MDYEPALGHTTSRFIGKIGLEALALRLQHMHGANDELVNHEGLDQLRAYVRRGSQKVPWPVHVRRIYPEGHVFDTPHQVIHEWTLLYTQNLELFAVVAIFGVEFTINLWEPTLDTYMAWLISNNNQSPLYPNTL